MGWYKHYRWDFQVILVVQSNNDLVGNNLQILILEIMSRNRPKMIILEVVVELENM